MLKHTKKREKNTENKLTTQQRQVWFIPLADERGVCR